MESFKPKLTKLDKAAVEQMLNALYQLPIEKQKRGEYHQTP